MSGWWERHVVPRIVDRSVGTDEVHELREAANSPLQGRVLEHGGARR